MDKLHEMVRPFDGGAGIEVSTWLRKIKLVAKLKKITELHNFIPLYLEGSAFAVYDQLTDGQKESGDNIEKALLSAFGQDQFGAYDNFRQRSWMPGEAVDVYLADLRRLARLAKVESDELVRCAFICGLPTDVSSQLRATAQISSTALADVADQARILMGDRFHGAMAAIKKKFACFECGGDHHVKHCKEKKETHKKVICFRCGEPGHIFRNCSGNGKGGSSAPAAPLHL